MTREEEMTPEEAIAEISFLKVAVNKVMEQALDMAIQALSQEPQSGVWVEIDDEPHEVWECDHCGFVIDGSGCIEPYEYRDTYKYCPNCGAKMESEEQTE